MFVLGHVDEGDAGRQRETVCVLFVHRDEKLNVAYAVARLNRSFALDALHESQIKREWILSYLCRLQVELQLNVRPLS